MRGIDMMYWASRLPTSVRARLEPFFGADLSSVSISEHHAVTDLGALAVTGGESIYFRPGYYDLHSSAGLELLGHELTHVLQQRDGRVSAPRGGQLIAYDAALEAEADGMGRRLAAWLMPRLPASPRLETKHRDLGEGSECLLQCQRSTPSVLQAKLESHAAFELFMYYQRAYPDREDLQQICKEHHRRLVRVHDTLMDAKAEIHRIVGPPTNPRVPPPGWTFVFVGTEPEAEPPNTVIDLRSIMQDQERSRERRSRSLSTHAPSIWTDTVRSSSNTQKPPRPTKLRVDKVKPVLDRVQMWDHNSQVSQRVSLSNEDVDDLVRRASEITTMSGANRKYEVIDNEGKEEKYEYKRVIKLVYWFGTKTWTGGGRKKPTYHIILK